MREILLVGIGGFIGSVMRYGVSRAMLPLSAASSIPWGTFTINVAGSLLIGVYLSWQPSQLGTYFFAIGICGGFTTFSTFSMEVFSAIRSGDPISAAIYVFISVILTVIAVWGGYWLGVNLK